MAVFHSAVSVSAAGQEVVIYDSSCHTDIDHAGFHALNTSKVHLICSFFNLCKGMRLISFTLQ
uniref:Uncharacterized protein n=1 Tax=Anguilla anguilla TaxID=7936 RepID=A0A0E9WEM0_ANGAN